VFVDTNVLVYLRDSTEPEKQRQAPEWVGHLWETGLGRISTQVLKEYYVTVTAKLAPGMPVEEAWADVLALRAWDPLPASADLIEDAWAVEDRYGFAFWDALVVAAAQRLDCALLLTEELTDGQELGGVRVVSPFRALPAQGP
jgi:predicted nucleic acid-binding protein